MNRIDKPLINRVANSGLITLNLEDYFPAGEVVVFDLKEYLFMELMLKEKDFRAALKVHDWVQYQGKHLLVDCSVDAIIPVWAYMLVTAYASPFTRSVFQGTPLEFYKAHYTKVLNNLDMETYTDQRIIIKGCGKKAVPLAAYVALTEQLRPIAKSIMYGEACSTVPVFKQIIRKVKK